MNSAIWAMEKYLRSKIGEFCEDMKCSENMDGYGLKVCKKCYESFVHNPNYYTIEEYTKVRTPCSLSAESIEKHRGRPLEPREVEVLNERHAGIRRMLTDIWDLPAENDI